ncbi:MAG: hypothetical protein WB676_14295 [Bryobacteraceae bacterium]
MKVNLCRKGEIRAIFRVAPGQRATRRLWQTLHSRDARHSRHYRRAVAQADGAEAYLFEVTLPANATRTLKVEEERTYLKGESS